MQNQPDDCECFIPGLGSLPFTSNNLWHELACAGGAIADDCSPQTDCRAYDEHQRNLLRRKLTECVVLARAQAIRSCHTAMRLPANPDDEAKHANDIKVAVLLAQAEKQAWP